MRCRLKAGPAQGEEAGHPRACSLALYLPPGVLVQTGKTNSAGGPRMHPGHCASLGHTRAYFKSGRVEPSAHQLGRLLTHSVPETLPQGAGVTHASQEKPCGFACKAGGSLRLPAPHTSPNSSRLLAEPAASWAALLFPVDSGKRLQTVPTLYCEVLGLFRSHRGPHQSRSTCPGLGWGGESGKNPRWRQS